MSAVTRTSRLVGLGVVLVCISLPGVNALADTGYGDSPRLSLRLDVTPTSCPVVPGQSPRLSLITDRIGYGESASFALNTGAYTLSADYFHLGDDGTPPCSPSGTVHSTGSYCEIDFSVSSGELAGFLDTGARVELASFRVLPEAITQVYLNGSVLGSLPVGETCEAGRFSAGVTMLLRSGSNTLRVEMGGTGDLPDCVVGDLQLVAGSAAEAGQVSVAVTPSFDSVGFSIGLGGAAYDDVRVEILAGSQVILNSIPSGGSASFSGLTDGTYSYIIWPVGSGEPLEQGQFMIDLSNQPPQIAAASAVPDTVDNSGQSTTLSVLATDSDGTIQTVTANLSQIGGPAGQALADQGNGLWSSLCTVPAGTTPADYALPIRVVDDRGAVVEASVALTVKPATALDSTVLTACGFEIRASQVIETATDTWQVSGNVQLTHTSGLPLLLDGTGQLTVTTGAVESINADVDVMLKADLGELGIVDLAHGEFAIAADGSLTLDGAAQYLLDEVVGHALDTDAMTVQLLFGATPGVQIGATAVFDELDGQTGNEAPAIGVDLVLGLDGSVSGTLGADPGALVWNLPVGQLSFSGLSWTGETVTIDGASCWRWTWASATSVPPISRLAYRAVPWAPMASPVAVSSPVPSISSTAVSRSPSVRLL